MVKYIQSDRRLPFLWGFNALAIILVALRGCTYKEPLKPYYFPASDKVYVYSSNDSVGKEYWHITPTEKGIRTLVFNSERELTQTTDEKFYKNGVNLESLQLTNGKAEVISGFVFPFNEISDKEVLLYHIKWRDNSTSTTYELIRNRRFVGYKNMLVFQDSVLCASFLLEERIISEQDGSVEMKTTGTEFYAKNIGLVYRKRRITDELHFEQKLLAIEEQIPD